MSPADPSAPQESGTSAPAPTSKRPGKLRRFFKKLLLLGASLVIACLLAELLVLITVGEQPKFPRHVVEAPWGLRYNEPNVTYRHKSADMTAWFKINGQGMRADRDYPYKKPAGVKRIISLGDSFTIGYEVSVGDTFSSVIERQLNSAGIKCEVLNCGVSGYGNAEECLYLERELMKYQPDLVLVSFCGNDLSDNVRSGLFAVQDGKLVAKATRYVPAGGLGNFLNQNWFFNILSERSNAFALVKERLTTTVKRDMVAENERNLSSAERSTTGPTTRATKKTDDANTSQRKLCVAILDRMYADCREKNIPLVIHSIATGMGERQDSMVDVFPVDEMNFARPGIYFVSSKQVLEPFAGKQQLYWLRSHYHWTPFSHKQVGEAIARLIVDKNLLQ